MVRSRVACWMSRQQKDVNKMGNPKRNAHQNRHKTSLLKILYMVSQDQLLTHACSEKSLQTSAKNGEEQGWKSICTEVTKSSKTRLWVGIVLRAPTSWGWGTIFNSWVQHYFEFWVGRAHLQSLKFNINLTPCVSVL